MSPWNSTFKSAGKPIQRKTSMRSKKDGIPVGMSRQTGRMDAKKQKGLAQRIAESLGRAIKHARGESGLLRSEAHRRNVATLACVCCGKAGPSQCAHANATKGAGLKVCDSLTFPACPDCHRAHDQGGVLTKAERWRREWEYIDAARALLIRQNKWPDHVEAAYQKAIVPLARMVHERFTSARLG